jgi:hypothetical protein
MCRREPNFSQKDTWVLRKGTLGWPKSTFCEFTRNSPFRFIPELKSGQFPQGIIGHKLASAIKMRRKSLTDKDLAKTIQVVFLNRGSLVQIQAGVLKSRSMMGRLFCLQAL